MKKVFFYQIFLLSIFLSLGLLQIFNRLAFSQEPLRLAYYCGICGGIGGVTYCLRGIYLNACVFKRWDKVWIPWYIIRPIVSFICGLVSYIFLKAGLLVLEAKQPNSASNYAFFALAFIAGLNVDKFIEKIEDIAQTSWGIRKSNSSRKEK